MKIYVENFDKTIEFCDKEFGTLLELLKSNGINIKSNCEGNGVCGKCHVSFDKNTYNKFDVSDAEYNVLDKLIENTPTSRLACMVNVDEKLDGAKIHIFNLK